MARIFQNVKPGPPDPMFDLKRRADSDNSANKVDLGVGIYRNEDGLYHELRTIKAAKKELDEKNLGHNYELTTGDEKFLNHAAEIVFGPKSGVLSAQCVSSVQTISGTGSCHLGAQFLQKHFTSPTPSSSRAVYLGTPTWGNYEPLFRLVGFSNIAKYTYYSPTTRKVAFDNLINAVRTAPPFSIFVLQACCHNPSGMDLSRDQWEALAADMKACNQFPFFDMAYQGLGGNSLEDDAWPIRYFAETVGFEMIVCQSFSKNFGLYGERCGALHVVTKSPDDAVAIKDQLRCLIRWEFSSSPAYGSRLVTIALEDEELRQDWLDELTSLRERLRELRTQFYTAIIERQIPGDWSNVVESTGLFCFLPLSPPQCEALYMEHIYLPLNGRVNISGLNERNLDLVVAALEAVVTSDVQKESHTEFQHSTSGSGQRVQSVL